MLPYPVISPKSTADAAEPQFQWEEYANGFMKFVDSAPTTYHANAFLAETLDKHDFVRLDERNDWSLRLEYGQKFYVSRGSTVLLAFVIGQDWKAEKGAGIVGTHIDSLEGIVKPISIQEPIDGFEMIGVAPYGGGLSSETWWDRDLGIAGRIFARETGGKICQRLVRIPHPVARIATLAPHFGRPAQGPFNSETQKVPFIGLVSDGKLPEPTEDEKKSPMVGKHSLRLLRALSKESGIPVKDFVAVDLRLFDTQAATYGGLDKEFLFCPRVDNKACTYTACYGLLEATQFVEKSDSMSIWVAYDNEEIGSLTRTGAQGNFLESIIDRLLSAMKSTHLRQVFYANSFFVSADVTHGVNPNFSDKYLENHKPALNKGVALKYHPGGRVITNASTQAFILELAARTNNTIQYFQVRNDSPSGGTIGPFVASKTGLRGVDLGIPQLSMHSVRATMGSHDVWTGVKFFKSFFTTWRAVDKEFRD